MIATADDLRDDQWARIEPHVPGGRKGRRGPRSDNRRFVGALIWMARSGARWCDLPERYGNCQTVKKRYYRRLANGARERLFTALAAEADLEWVSLNVGVVRAHGQAATARRQRGDLRPRVLAARVAA